MKNQLRLVPLFLLTAPLALVSCGDDKGIEGAADDAKDAMEDVADDAKDAAEDMADGVKDAVEGAGDAIEDATDG